MKGRVPKKELGSILVQAKCAVKNIRAQRERLLHFQLRLQPNQPVEGDAPAQLSTDDIASGLFLVCFQGLEAGARYLTTCLTMAAQNGELPSLPLDFAVISDEQLFDRLLALRLPRRPVTQAQAFARLEAAAYAVKLNQEYCLKRCLKHLGYPAAGATDEDSESSEDCLSLPGTTDEYSQDGGEIGGPDPVAAATEDLTKISLSASNAAATGETPQAATIDMDQARTYLDRACTLADLAVKHVDLAITAISSCLDPAQVASISAFADSVAYTK